MIEIKFVFAGRLQQHPGLWLSASAWRLKIMWTVENIVNSGSNNFELTSHSHVHRIEFRICDESFCNATLVAYDDHKIPSLVQQVDGLTCSGKKLHILPARHVLALGSLTVDHSVAIEKDSLLHGISPAPPIQK